jgi:hypothetical protein
MITAIGIVISGITLALTSGDYKWKDYYFLHSFVAVQQIMSVNAFGVSMCVASDCVFGFILQQNRLYR